MILLKGKNVISLRKNGTGSVLCNDRIKKGAISALLFAVLFCIACEFFFAARRVPQSSAPTTDLIGSEDFDMVESNALLSYGYKYTITGDDPQLIFYSRDGEKEVSSVLISLYRPLTEKTVVWFFFADSDNGFTAENAVAQLLKPGSCHYVVDIPSGSYDKLRIDVDTNCWLRQITIGSAPISVGISYGSAFSFGRIVLLLFIGFFAAAAFLYIHRRENRWRLSVAEMVFLLVCFFVYFWWAQEGRLDSAPDEAMRYQVTQFLYEHNRLPVGDELISYGWGFSYAHLPTMLGNILSYLTMKGASLFSDASPYLLIGARMAQVFSGTAAVYFIMKTGKRLFSAPVKWLMTVSVAMLPQFIFLTAYVNNDIVATMGCAMILYAWVTAIQEDFSPKVIVLLSVGMATCAASYYNSYAWILFSIVLFIVVYLKKHPGAYKKMLSVGGCIAALTFVLGGYLFVRHVILYGDLLGFKTTAYYSELYAIEELKAANRPTPAVLGESLGYMLFDRHWLRTSFQSFIGCFGYMNKPVDTWVLILFAGLCGAGMLFAVIGTVAERIKKEKVKPFLPFLALLLVGVTAVTFGLSVYYSYFNDFQPQGRYCFAMLPALAVLSSFGYEKAIRLIKRTEVRYALCAILAAFTVTASAYSYLYVFR